jgi:RND family efflux transporter MFP subunit
MLNRVLALALCCGALLVAGCNKPVEGAAAEDKQSAAGTTPGGEAKKSASERILIPVEVAHPQRADISSYFETTTRIVAENRVEVLSKGAGICLSVTAEEGDRVNKGAVLAELDKTEMDAQMRQTLIQVEQRKTAFQIAERSLAEGIGAPVERDNTKFAYDQSKALLEMNNAQLRNQTITAPIGGVVTRRTIQAGILVAPAMPLFSLVDTDSYVLPIQVPEKELSRLSVGQEARVRVDAMEGQEFTAKVRRINPSVDPLSGTVKVVLDFTLEDKAKLRDAAFARVRLVMETHKNALVVPKDAVLEENARMYLMTVLPEGQANAQDPSAAPETTAKPGESVFVAQRIEVKTGLEDSNSIEVLSGVDDNSQVVVLGQHTLKQNSYVTITSAEKELKAREGVSFDEAIAAAKKKSEEEAKKQKEMEEAAAK